MAEAKQHNLLLPGMDLSSEEDNDEQYAYDSDNSGELSDQDEKIQLLSNNSVHRAPENFKQAIFANLNIQNSAGLPNLTPIKLKAG